MQKRVPSFRFRIAGKGRWTMRNREPAVLWRTFRQEFLASMIVGRPPRIFLSVELSGGLDICVQTHSTFQCGCITCIIEIVLWSTITVFSSIISSVGPQRHDLPMTKCSFSSLGGTRWKIPSSSSFATLSSSIVMHQYFKICAAPANTFYFPIYISSYRPACGF
jgi:hypothetical protein